MEGLEITILNSIEFLKDNLEFRIDAEYFLKSNLEKLKTLEKTGYRKISEFGFVTDGIHTSIDYSENSNINLFSATTPRENFFDLTRQVFISEKAHILNPRTALKENDIVISTVGTIGNCAVVNKSVLPANSDRHVGIIRLNNNDFYPRYISTFLLSKYGRFQTMRESTGNVQLNLFLYRIRTLKIADLSRGFQKNIEKTILKSEEKRETSKQLYQQAEDTLMFEVGLNTLSNDFLRKIELQLKPNKTPEETIEYLEKYTVAERNTFEAAHDMFMEMLDANPDLIDDLMERGEVELAKRLLKGMETQLKLKEYDVEQAEKNKDLLIKGYEAQKNLIALSEAKLKNYNIKKLSDSFIKTGRLDAEYYQQKYEVIEEVIKKNKNGYAKLGDFIKNYSTGYPYKSDSYSDIEGIPLIRINNISNGELDLSNATKIPLTDLELSIKDIAQENDILISMSGTIGNSCKIRNGIKAVVNQRIMRITTNNYNVDVLPLIINSAIGKSQLERIGTGGVQTNLSSNDIKEIIIPIIDINKQQEIANFVEQSFKLKEESERLLEVAKKAVEMAIEEGEEKAMEFIKEEGK